MAETRTSYVVSEAIISGIQLFSKNTLNLGGEVPAIELLKLVLVYEQLKFSIHQLISHYLVCSQQPW